MGPQHLVLVFVITISAAALMLTSLLVRRISPGSSRTSALWVVRTKYIFSGDEGPRAWRMAHVIILLASLVSLIGLLFYPQFVVDESLRPQAPDLIASDRLNLSTVLVLFMLFGFLAFEAGAVPAAYRNASAEKNLLVIMVSLASYLLFGRMIHSYFSGQVHPSFMAYVFHAGFACTVSLIVSNATTERASLLAYGLCSACTAGLAYPALAGLTWGKEGVLRSIGFMDASGAGVVHLTGAAASLAAITAIGPRARLQRLRFLRWAETPDFRSPWTIVGGLFLMFGWLGFNSGTSDLPYFGQAFRNTMIGACAGGITAALLTLAATLAGTLPIGQYSRRSILNSSLLRAVVDSTLRSHRRPRFVLGMMGGLVAVTANGAFPHFPPLFAAVEASIGGLVAVVVSTALASSSRAEHVDDPLGVIGTHGCAALVGLLFSVLHPLSHLGILHQIGSQLFGISLCILAGGLVGLLPCLLLRSFESSAFSLLSSEAPPSLPRWLAARCHLRLSTLDQLRVPIVALMDSRWNTKTADVQVLLEVNRAAIYGRAGDLRPLDDTLLHIYSCAVDSLPWEYRNIMANYVARTIALSITTPTIRFVAIGASAEYMNRDCLSDKLSQVCDTMEQFFGRAKTALVPHSQSDTDSTEALVWAAAMLSERAALELAERPDAAQSPTIAAQRDDITRRQLLRLQTSLKLVSVGAWDATPCVRNVARRGLIDSFTSPATSRWTPRVHVGETAQGAEPSNRAALDTEPSSQVPLAHPVPINSGMDVRPGIIHLKGSLRDHRDDILRFFATGDYYEIYVECSVAELTENRLQDILDLRRMLRSIKHIIEPVVVGPISRIDSATAKLFASWMVRTTALSFEDYCLVGSQFSTRR